MLLPRIGVHVEQPPVVSSRYCCVRTLTLPLQCEKIIRSGQSWACPVNSGARLRPSSGFSLATVMLASSASVGSRSMAPAICVTLVPGGMCPGQRTNSGERTPPSSVEPLRPFMPPFQRQLLGPLSLK